MFNTVNARLPGIADFIGNTMLNDSIPLRLRAVVQIQTEFHSPALLYAHVAHRLAPFAEAVVAENGAGLNVVCIKPRFSFLPANPFHVR